MVYNLKVEDSKDHWEAASPDLDSSPRTATSEGDDIPWKDTNEYGIGQKQCKRNSMSDNKTLQEVREALCNYDQACFNFKQLEGEAKKLEKVSNDFNRLNERLQTTNYLGQNSFTSCHVDHKSTSQVRREIYD